jgi:DNA (cytosine-5)-methyltransferase 1
VRTIDLFAGAGGSTLGALAAGCEVVWCGNHWPLAVEVHRRNAPPQVEHSCADLMATDWRTVPVGDAVWASPACQGHSRAASKGGNGRRGSAPHHDALRSTAWAVVSCLEAHRSPIAVIENVPEFLRWPLAPAWRAALNLMGYSLGDHIIDAADLGVPQSRKRLFIIATLSKAPLRLQIEKREHTPFRSFIDEDATGWRPVASCGAGVRSRVARARRNFPRGLMLSQYVTNHPGRSLDRTIGTITTKVQWAAVRRNEIRFLNALELKRAMGFPDDFQLDGRLNMDCKLLGNAVAPPVAQEIFTQLRRTG